MSAIKKFFEKKAIESKFKKAGQGRRLTDSKNIPQSSGSNVAKSSSRSGKKAPQSEMTDEKRMAAMAAMARLELKRENESKGYSKGGMTMKAEMLAEQKEAEALARKYAVQKPLNLDASKVVSGVYFTCPGLGLIQPMLKDDLLNDIEEYLTFHLGEDPELTSSLMIHMLNKNQAEVRACIEMLERYLRNIISKPGEVAYRRIKCGNKVLNEKVLNCKGANEFLQAVGFERRVVEGQDGGVDEYLVLETQDEDTEDMVEHLKHLLDVLKASESIPLHLCRDLKVFNLKSSAQGAAESAMEVPDEFYNIRPEELKREQKLREEAVKEMGMLVTKEMRERERLKALRRYRYGVIRVRLPDDYMVQGTFKSGETFSEVRAFVGEMMSDGAIEFKLAAGLGGYVEADDKTLAELNLVPASLLTLSIENNPSGSRKLLKQEYREMAQSIR